VGGLTLRRDRVTRIVYAELAVFGFFIYGFGPAVPLLRDEQGISSAVSALHGTGLALGAIVAGMLGAPAVALMGRGAVMRVALVGLCAATGLLTASVAVPVTLLGATVAGISAGLLVNTHAAILTDHHGAAAAAAISEANAVAAAVGILGPLALGAGVAIGVGWRAGLLVSVGLAAAALLYSRGTRMPDAPAVARPAPRSRVARLPAAYWMAWLIFVLCVAVEFCMTIWASDLLRQRDGLHDGAATTAIFFMVAGMAVGRLTGSRLALRHRPEVLLGVALAVNGAGFALFWLSGVVVLAVVGLFVAGVGMAMQFPLNVSRAIAAAGGRSDVAAARTGIGAGLAIGTAPFALGVLADAVGTAQGMLLVPGLLAAASIVLLASRSANAS
jgi:predicted MFS family arabinose efflux permease